MTTNTEWETRELGIHDASRSLARNVNDLSTNPGVVSVRRYSKPVLAIMNWDDYEGLMETLEIVKDTEAMESFRRAVKQFEARRGPGLRGVCDRVGLLARRRY